MYVCCILRLNLVTYGIIREYCTVFIVAAFILTTIRGDKSSLYKNLNAARPSEHPPVRGGNVKTFRWDHRCKYKTYYGI